MAELEAMAGRLGATRDRLRTIPATGSHEQGPADPRTGERWDRFNILGHVAEVLPFWSREIGRAARQGGKLGREPGSSGRLEGIEGGRLLSEEVLRERIEGGVGQALELLGALAEADLDRVVDTYNQGEMTIRQALETFLVGHFEAHVQQLGELP